MKLTRRNAVAGALASAGVLSNQSFADGNSERDATTPQANVADFPVVGPRVNFEQAQRVMDELNIDGIVVGAGSNAYHLTGYWPLTTRMGFPVNTIAVLTRQNIDQPSLVISAFTFYYQLADHHRPNDFLVYTYTAPADVSEVGHALPAAPFKMFPDRGEVPMDSIESHRLSLTQNAMEKLEAQANLTQALKKALADAGLLTGVVATDLPEIKNLIEDMAPNVGLINSDIALSRIRPIKSPMELNLMRQAAAANAEAALAAVKLVLPGMTYRDLRALFYAEAAKRKNVGTFMVVDRVSSDQYDHEFVEGQAFLIDAVSAFQGYHGDYGRTVFIGEPKGAMRIATDAMALAWNEVRDSLRPGMTFSQIRENGQSTLRKLGFNYDIPFNPHSVGLFHTDHLANDPTQAFKTDVVLEKNMIISVDCPLLEAGIGGSAHLEDLVLITEQGGETINAKGDQSIII